MVPRREIWEQQRGRAEPELLVSRAQRLIGWLACMTVAVSSIGVPLPAQSVKKSGDPFPCQGCACGCKDAESCWRDCCCHTNGEKLAWARRHGVKPPAFVIAAATRERTCDERYAAPCCRSNQCDDKTVASGTRSCCSKQPHALAACANESPKSDCPRCESELPAPSSRHRDSDDAGVVQLVAKLRCSGLTLSLSLLPPCVVPSHVPIGMEHTVSYAHSQSRAALYEPPFLPIVAPPPESRCA
jgi:hypothetical protein